MRLILPMLVVLAGGAGFAAGYWGRSAGPTDVATARVPLVIAPPSRLAGATKEDSGRLLRRSGFRLVSPIVDCELRDVSVTRSLSELSGRLETEIDRAKSAGRLKDAAYYLRDLQNGVAIGHREDTLFSPASLLKVTILITALLQNREQPGFLDRKILYLGADRGSNDLQGIKPKTNLAAGELHTARALIEAMIMHSDNNAAESLVAEVTAEALERLDTELGLRPLTGRPDALSVQSYATLFRVLYNASYLNAEDSEWALELLTKPEFRAGLVAGVPEGVVVAHKFGERSIHGEGAVTRQFHHCGIVYAPGRPYLMCLMTRGTEIESLVGLAERLSRVTYEHLTASQPRSAAADQR